MKQSSEQLLLDTNVVLHAVRDSSLWRRIDAVFHLRHASHTALISAVTVGECLAMAKRNGWGVRKQEFLEKLLRQLVILDINREPILRAYAELHQRRIERSRERTPGQNDLWIAATARATRARLLTTDRDFDIFSPDLIQRDFFDPRSA